MRHAHRDYGLILDDCDVLILLIFDEFLGDPFYHCFYSILLFTHVFSISVLVLYLAINIYKKQFSASGFISVPLTRLDKPSKVRLGEVLGGLRYDLCN